MSDEPVRHVRHALTTMWIASILGIIGFAAYMTFSGGLDIPRASGRRQLADYLFPAGLSFVAQYVDASLGMGCGTTLTVLLVMSGFPVTQVVVAVLLQQLVAGGLGAIAHHAVAVTAMSEAMSCIGGFVACATMGVDLPWRLFGALIAGGALAAIFAVATVRALPEVGLNRVISGTYSSPGALLLYAGLS